MAVNRQPNVQRNASFRRIAIVLSSLPSATAARLLGTIPAEDKSQLRRAMATLSDVDPLERQRALQSFTSTLQNNRGTTSQSGGGSPDEIHLSRVSVDSQITGSQFASESSSDPSDADFNGADDSPLSFVRGVTDSDLATVLSSERPQTLAIVLASIPPAKAARVLPLLDKTLRMETITRIGRLGEIPDDALVEVAAHLKERIESTTADSSSSSGQRALNAILAELPRSGSDRHSEPVRRFEVDSESEVANTLQAETISAVQDEFVPSSARGEFVSSPTRSSTAPDVLRDLPASEEIRISPHTTGGRDVDLEPALSTTSMSTDEIQDCLIGLTPVDLCQALGSVETHTAILAICGLPTDVTDAALGLLPKASARDVRRQLMNVGSIDLREIDEAKSLVASVALQQDTDEEYESSSPGRPAAVAA